MFHVIQLPKFKMHQLINKLTSFIFPVDTPDCYIEVEILNTADSLKRTKCISNDPNPQWFEKFNYFLHPNPTQPTICKVIFYNKELKKKT